MIKCVIFDLDGTLIDDEKFTISSKIIEARKFGYKVKEEDVIASLGLSSENSRKHFTSIYGSEFPVDFLKGKRTEYIINDMMKNGIVLKPGVKEILNFLDENGIKKVICTSTINENLKKYRLYGDLFDRFDEIISGDMVKKGKPYPDIFLLGSERIAIPVEECLVIEDSNTGVEAALKGGFNVIMIPDLVKPKKEYLGQIKIYKDMFEVINYLKKDV